jgi:hypothetical protein
MTERIVSEEDWGVASYVLANAVVAEKGKMACIDTSLGQVTKGKASTTLLPIGTFMENLTGDGTAEVLVKLFDEIRAYWWENDDEPNNVAAEDIGQECYVLDDETVTMDATGHSKAGRVLAVNSTYGVLVQSGMAVTGPAGANASELLGGGVADRTALKAIAAASRYDGKTVLVRSDNSQWVFASTSTLTDTTENLVCTPAVGTGRWLRVDRSFCLNIPITFATADATAIFTVPAGYVLKVVAHPYWDITTQFAGGTNSSIGLSSSKTGYSTKGDLISATLTAALAAGVRKGTIGDKLDTVTEMQALHLEATDTLRHDRIVDAFTSGVGAVRVPVMVCTAPAAA